MLYKGFGCAPHSKAPCPISNPGKASNFVISIAAPSFSPYNINNFPIPGHIISYADIGEPHPVPRLPSGKLFYVRFCRGNGFCLQAKQEFGNPKPNIFMESGDVAMKFFINSHFKQSGSLHKERERLLQAYVLAFSHFPARSIKLCMFGFGCPNSSGTLAFFEFAGAAGFSGCVLAEYMFIPNTTASEVL